MVAVYRVARLHLAGVRAAGLSGKESVRPDRAAPVGWDGAVTTETATGVFEPHRPVLLGVAYRMPGRVADAEDVVREARLRWSGAARDDVREPRGYLVRVTTRLAIDRLRQIKARGETYVGPWLPEPYVTDFGDTVPAERAVLADSVSPRRPRRTGVAVTAGARRVRAERGLRLPVRRHHRPARPRRTGGAPAVRDRRHVEERRPRYEVDPAQRRDLTERFLAAAADGDLEGLMALLAPEVRLVGDSGGKSRAPLRVLQTADKVGRFLVGAARQGLPGLSVRFLELNGGPALLILSGGKPDSVFRLDVADGRVQSVYIIRNPDKLRSLAAA